MKLTLFMVLFDNKQKILGIIFYLKWPRINNLQGSIMLESPQFMNLMSQGMYRR